MNRFPETGEDDGDDGDDGDETETVGILERFLVEDNDMEIGILYESKEWSSYELEKDINALGVTAKLIDVEQDDNEDEILACDMIVNRVFASAVFRRHQKSLDRMPHIIGLMKARGIPMINPYEAHFYEISKALSTTTLANNEFLVPEMYGVFTPEQLLSDLGNLSTLGNKGIEYPCIVKPNCGGRTNYTFIVKDHSELVGSMKTAPNIEFIAEEYIKPEYGFLTRIEIIDRSCKLILKRSVTENGLSAYHLGSVYAAYDDCCNMIRETAVKAMDCLHIETGSMDIIENNRGFYIIDINSVSNVSEDNTEMFSFDLMKETAAYIVKKYRQLKGEAL